MSGLALALDRAGDHWQLRLTGDWSLAGLPVLEPQLARLPPELRGILICDWSRADSPGLGPVWALLERLRALGGDSLEVRHLQPAPHAVLLLAGLHVEAHVVADTASVAGPRRGPLGRLGRWAVAQGREARALLDFLGRIASVFGEMFGRPRALRLSSLSRHLFETAITAVPVVSLIAFLISVIVAYLGSQQFALFGADIFVVDLVTIAVLRELGVLLTAIIVAGRSGSAFAAEIGVMRLNEETDALRAMGLNPLELLVVPRVIALVLALPALTVVADAMGLAGGGLLCVTTLHIPVAEFESRLREALAPTTFWAGLIKAPVFGALIGLVGTYRGMQVRESARELGRLTTVAVVQSIFLVILADAMFAIYFNRIDF